MTYSYQLYLELESNYTRITIGHDPARTRKYTKLQINSLVYKSSSTSDNLGLIIQGWTNMYDIATGSEFTKIIPLLGVNTINLYSEYENVMTCVLDSGLTLHQFDVRVLEDGSPSANISPTNKLKLTLTFFE